MYPPTFYYSVYSRQQIKRPDSQGGPGARSIGQPRKRKSGWHGEQGAPKERPSYGRELPVIAGEACKANTWLEEQVNLAGRPTPSIGGAALAPALAVQQSPLCLTWVPMGRPWRPPWPCNNPPFALRGCQWGGPGARPGACPARRRSHLWLKYSCLFSSALLTERSISPYNQETRENVRKEATLKNV